MIVPQPGDRSALRQRLLAQREEFVAGPRFEGARRALGAALDDVLRQLEPEWLGSYFPVRSEFTPSVSSYASQGLALPYASRGTRAMHYRRWDGREPTIRDECGIASTEGAPVVPDVVLVPCVGYTDELYRLGYGGGYFDRWLAAHPGVTAVGVAWSLGRLGDTEFLPEPQDLPLSLIVTEHGVVS